MLENYAIRPEVSGRTLKKPIILGSALFASVVVIPPKANTRKMAPPEDGKRCGYSWIKVTCDDD
jgi:hypothetical protein